MHTDSLTGAVVTHGNLPMVAGLLTYYSVLGCAHLKLSLSIGGFLFFKLNADSYGWNPASSRIGLEFPENEGK